MAEWHTCPQGHRWEPAAKRAGTGPSARDLCPQCGAEPAAQPIAIAPGGRVVTSEEAWPGPAIRPVRQSLNKEFGRYQIIRTLGEGGMGTVYLAHDTQLDRPVALKVPIFTEDDGPDVLKRFYREARTAATILHSNICPVYDVGEINGIHFLSMAYIEGKLLWNYIAGGQPLPYRHAAVLVRKLALAIQEAHNHGIIHRDLKPANVIINKNSEPIIMDFGLAKRVDDQNQRLTKTGQVLGTIVYMSPEQVTGNMALMGPPADIYSLGVILYELLTAHAPYEGTPASVVTNIVTKPPPRVAEWRQDVPARLEAICQKAMAKDIGDRFASMTEFGAALAEYLRLDAQAGAPATGKPAAKPTGGMPAKVVAKAKAGAANAPARAPTPGPRKVAPTPRGNGRAAPAKNGGEQPVLAIPDAEAAAPIWRRLPVWAWIAGACGAIALFVLLLLVML